MSESTEDNVTAYLANIKNTYKDCNVMACSIETVKLSDKSLFKVVYWQKDEDV